MGRFCPSVTLECGLSGDELGVKKALNFLKKSMDIASSSKFSEFLFKEKIFKSIGKFKIPEGSNISFIPREEPLILGELSNQVLFFNDLEQFNLKLMYEKTKLGYICGSKTQVEVLGEFGEDLFDDFFTIEENQLVTKKDLYVAMVTKNITVAKEDCFLYPKPHRVSEGIN